MDTGLNGNCCLAGHQLLLARIAFGNTLIVTAPGEAMAAPDKHFEE
jgi:hypothetical protein